MKTPTKMINGLNFSSWFDLWHTHLDWHSKGEKSWEIRKRFLKRLFGLYEEMNRKIGKKQRKYQAWCSIDLDDAGYDAVYLHTKNPNQDNYPIKFERNLRRYKWKYPLVEFIEKNNFQWFKVKGWKIIIVYKTGNGEGLF